MIGRKRDSERITMPRQVTGAIMVFEPLTVLDISDLGVLVETTFPLRLDSLHDFRLSLDDRSVVVKGRIVHCQIGDLMEGVVHYRSGVEFVELPEHARVAISEFMEAERLAREVRPILDAELADDL